MTELYEFSNQSTSVLQGNFNIGLSLGNQKHSTGRLMLIPRPRPFCQVEQTNRNGEGRHQSTIEEHRTRVRLLGV
eukprot:4008041-Heterocapsa_arctica.AAC.1